MSKAGKVGSLHMEWTRREVRFPPFAVVAELREYGRGGRFVSRLLPLSLQYETIRRSFVPVRVLKSSLSRFVLMQDNDGYIMGVELITALILNLGRKFPHIMLKGVTM